MYFNHILPYYPISYYEQIRYILILWSGNSKSQENPKPKQPLKTN